ncbi:hypothetical protein ColTof4_10368 [Colletotrichum tofieldiae]|nr:hypothetical protein ColTof3_05974 [Colletotrichum tofieldiae]GKT77945.1 hypothetical protein ColTof4_10368 [Colletotrichum tofieldiae]
MSPVQVPLPASEQFGILDQSILNEGYAQTWLNQRLPPFTTPEYTLLPFHAESKTLEGSTTKYWTQLECWPAQAFKNGPPGKHNHDFLNGRGCNASEIDTYGNFLDTLPYKMLYIGFHNSPWADYWLASTCSKASAGNQFLATWGQSKSAQNEINLTSIFCETNYYKQPVNATVRSTDLVPLEQSIVPLGPRERLSETEFNSTAFEHLLGAGVSSTELQVKREYPFGRLLEQHQQVERLGIMWPMSPMAGFAIGSRKGVTTLDVYRDEISLGNAYNSTHKMLFSLALRRVLTNATNAATTVGTIDVEQHGIINSTTLLDKFAGKGCLPEEMLKESFKDQRFKLFCGCQSSSRQMVIKVVDIRDESGEEQRVKLLQPDAALSVGHYSPIKPLALRREIGFVVVLSMMAAVGALIYLKLLEQRNKGIIRPDTSFEVLQILENYVPTIFATLLEPFWVLVNRLLCILQPFRDLWSGKRSAESSINARYTSLPPQLVFWRAARSGHLILTAMCALALLSNLLAVGLGGLFNEKPIAIEHPHEFRQTMMPRLSNNSLFKEETRKFFSNAAPYEVPFYITMNNVSQGTPLTPWVNHDYFFQPFTISPNDPANGYTYTARTRGFGTHPSCSDYGTYRTQGEGPRLNYTMTRNGEAVQGCQTAFTGMGLDLDDFDVFPGPATGEIIAKLDGFFKLSQCEVPLLLGWSRISHATNSSNAGTSKEKNGTTTRRSQITDLADKEMQTSFVVCDPVFTTAMFDVTVDSQGYILNASQATESSGALDYSLSTNHTDAISAIVNKLFVKSSQGPWHNDSLSRDWMNYLLKIQPGYADLLDPTFTPNTSALIPAVETVYRQVFALTLGNNQFLLDTYPEPIAIPGIRHSTETRIFMDTSALIISLVVLGVNILVAIALYGLAIKHFLPRMPTTIGSILAYLAPSRAVREYEGPGSLRSATFSFGRYVGEDGRAHVGIELDPFVVPVELSALRKGDTEPRKGLLRRLLGRGKAGRGDDTWL